MDADTDSDSNSSGVSVIDLTLDSSPIMLSSSDLSSSDVSSDEEVVKR